MTTICCRHLMDPNNPLLLITFCCRHIKQRILHQRAHLTTPPKSRAVQVFSPSSMSTNYLILDLKYVFQLSERRGISVMIWDSDISISRSLKGGVDSSLFPWTLVTSPLAVNAFRIRQFNSVVLPFGLLSKVWMHRSISENLS